MWSKKADTHNDSISLVPEVDIHSGPFPANPANRNAALRKSSMFGDDHRNSSFFQPAIDFSITIDQDGRDVHVPERNAGWLQTSTTNVAEVIGIGILGLPYTVSRLGWYTSISLLVLVGTTNAIAHLVLSAIIVEHPQARTWAAVGGLVGPRTRSIVESGNETTANKLSKKKKKKTNNINSKSIFVQSWFCFCFFYSSYYYPCFIHTVVTTYLFAICVVDFLASTNALKSVIIGCGYNLCNTYWYAFLEQYLNVFFGVTPQPPRICL